jgi:hypothetical protein
MSRTAELTAASSGEDGAVRKIGSVHRIQCKRNKLGREGKNQEVEVDLYIDGGMDWWSPLVRKLSKDYPSVVRRAGAYYTWQTPNTNYVDPATKKPAVIDCDKSYRESELAVVIRNSAQAKEIIRKAFGIPDLPAEKEVAEIEATRKKKRKASKTEEPEPTAKQVALV